MRLTEFLVVNIGNARLYGLEKDLKMPTKSNQYQVAVSILFVTYCVSPRDLACLPYVY